MKKEIIVTGDGSHSLRIPDWDEQYHSTHGAIQEAQHVFIEAGLNAFKGKNELSIFEVGFGTGLNVLMTLEASKNQNRKINYHSIEAFPLGMNQVRALNFTERLGLGEKGEAEFERIHELSWGELHELRPGFYLRKIEAKLQDFASDVEVDIIYFDAFGPRVQEELWSEEILGKMYKMLLPGGFLVTYCAKGAVKRALKAVGFEVESLPGPPGKREMTRAWKK